MFFRQMYWMIALLCISCGGGQDNSLDSTPDPVEPFAEKINYFPTIAELEENQQSTINITFAVQGAEFIRIDVNAMASCTNEDDTCVILVNNGVNTLEASGDFQSWTGGLAAIQCDDLTEPLCTVEFDSSGNRAMGVSSQ